MQIILDDAPRLIVTRKQFWVRGGIAKNMAKFLKTADPPSHDYMDILNIAYPSPLEQIIRLPSKVLFHQS